MENDEKSKGISVSSSWVFNRLCDEPARLRVELNDLGNDYVKQHGFVIAMQSFQRQYSELLTFQKLVAEMRLQTNPEITIINDTPYMKVKSK